MSTAPPHSEPLLEIVDLVSEFTTDHGPLKAVDGVSLTVTRGGTLGIVGESGCGKSVLAMSIMGLLPDPPGRIRRGVIRFDGQDLRKLEPVELRRMRGNRIAMIFQEPMSSLNPVYTVGQQITEAMRLHQRLSAQQARKKAIELLQRVGIPAAETRIDAYPYELSGGMRQRVMIAMAISCEPDLLIADEPTTALDVTIQAQILQLLANLQEERGMSIIMITHDLGVIAEFVDEVLVMYAGKAVERSKTVDLFETPQHPYTRGLLASVPRDVRRTSAGRVRLPTIEGVVPDLRDLKEGCRFRDRCPDAMARCAESEPPFEEITPGRWAACYYPGQPDPNQARPAAGAGE
ncbi:MAG: ABC transporter ATP-binding protein [Myxococcales bacterium]|nr:ABC transporter ATP-binding protein [Myxococcales bacterium]MDD9969841.1 ABC transporter ATP-binding protein [Myxococcales bacterium]